MDTVYYTFNTRRVKVSGGPDLVRLVPASSGARKTDHAGEIVDLEQFRKHKIEEKFIDLITRYDFDLLDPDQAYLNYLCDGKILTLPNGWNKEPLPCEGDLNIVHYALYKKPWQYDDVLYGEYFWEYAEKSPYRADILNRKAAFGDKEKAEKAAMAKEILEHGIQIAESDYTFVTKLGRK